MYSPEDTTDRTVRFFRLQGEGDRDPKFYYFRPAGYSIIRPNMTRRERSDFSLKRISVMEYQYLKAEDDDFWAKMADDYDPRKFKCTKVPTWREKRQSKVKASVEAKKERRENMYKRDQYWDANCALFYRAFLKYNKEPVDYTEAHNGRKGSRDEAIRRYLKIARELKGQTELYVGDRYEIHLEYYPYIGSYTGPTLYEMGFSLFFGSEEMGRILDIRYDGDYLMISLERSVVSLKRQLDLYDPPTEEEGKPKAEVMDEIFVDGPEPEDKNSSMSDIFPYEERKDLEESMKQSLSELYGHEAVVAKPKKRKRGDPLVLSSGVIIGGDKMYMDPDRPW